jgi:hydroxypyruvate isomerase
MKAKISRRSALKSTAGAALVGSVASTLARRLECRDRRGGLLKGRINHSVCKWCYGKIPLDEFCQAAKAMGLKSVELLTVEDFPTLKKYELVCAMVSGVPGGIVSGLNRVENHDKILAFYEKTAPLVASAGYKNIICFSGNRGGMSDEQGLENCAKGLKRIAPVCGTACSPSWSY